MKKNINSLDYNEWNHSQEIDTTAKKLKAQWKKTFNSIWVATQSIASLASTAAKAITIWTAASLMSACMEPDWPAVEPDVQTREKWDTTRPNIRIVIPDSTKKYTIDIVINPNQNS